MKPGEMCAICGVPLPLPQDGKLIIQEAAADKVLPGDVRQLDTKRAFYHYHSHKELLQQLAVLQNAGFSDRKSTIGELSALTSITVSELYERVKYQELTDVIQYGALNSHLQPIINTEDNEIFGYEHLLRPAERQTPPNVLFDFAHRAGLYSMLDQRARQTAVKSRSEQQIPAGVKSFINFLPSTIYNPDFCLRQTFAAVEAFNVDPNDLVFEVVETERMDDVSRLKRILERYKQEGMKVALDDVGAGYATLEMFKELNPDYVKIDRTYVSYCDQDKVKQFFLEKVMKIAASLGTKILAEGIERKEELVYCKSIGVDLAQGYFIGKPNPHPASGESLFA